jgi:hypothetical protein
MAANTQLGLQWTAWGRPTCYSQARRDEAGYARCPPRDGTLRQEAPPISLGRDLHGLADANHPAARALDPKCCARYSYS